MTDCYLTRDLISETAFAPQQVAVDRIDPLTKILQAVCKVTRMGFAAIARVSEGEWVAYATHDELQLSCESPIYSILSNGIWTTRQANGVNAAVNNDVQRLHPASSTYGFQNYVSTPIILPDGTFFGTLCAIDPHPARLDAPDIISTFKLFAELISTNIMLLDRLGSTEGSLRTERKKADSREQFMAVVAHDLRNPLAAISTNVATLQLMPMGPKALRIVGRIEESVFRMAGLVEDMLDFTRGYLGGGLTLQGDADSPLAPVLAQIIAELSAVWPDRTLESQFTMDEPVHCDHRRVGQLFANLLGNALAYGTPDAPVRVRAISNASGFELSVSNAGEPIPPATLQRLFDPFFRGEGPANKQGLGLGLYIASEVARAHGGTLDASSSPQETCFTFRMPRA